jgi:hypothetical protein
MNFKKSRVLNFLLSTYTLGTKSRSVNAEGITKAKCRSTLFVLIITLTVILELIFPLLDIYFRIWNILRFPCSLFSAGVIPVLSLLPFCGRGVFGIFMGME